MQIKIAGAGAGKTTAMADKIIELYADTDASKMIFCITFTNNAAACIEKKLQIYFGIIPKNIIVSTIHSFLYKEFIKPYYFLLFGKHYEQISIAQLPQENKYKRTKISRLENRNIIHQTVIPERAKWIIVKKSDDRKLTKDNRKIIMNEFKKYCGGICIDEAQDIDSDMHLIINAFDEISIPIILMGDPKQDLKGYKCLDVLVKDNYKNVEYIGICHRCPQNHLILSNQIVSKKEQQYSQKKNGDIIIRFESERSCSELIKEEKYGLNFISQKKGKFETHNYENNNGVINALFEEIKSELERLHSDKSELIINRAAYYYALNLLERYSETNNKTIAMNTTFKYESLSKQAYGIIINILVNNQLIETDEKVYISSIESIKGQESENCLFVLTSDLAAYLFGEKTDSNKTKNKLYVALTRSLNKLTIFITDEVENKYGKGMILDFFKNKRVCKTE